MNRIETVDELIAALQAIKTETGGETLVYMTGRDWRDSLVSDVEKDDDGHVCLAPGPELMS